MNPRIDMKVITEIASPLPPLPLSPPILNFEGKFPIQSCKHINLIPFFLRLPQPQLAENEERRKKERGKP